MPNSTRVASKCYNCCCCLVTESCPTLATLGTVARQAPLSIGFPTRILEWVAISFSRESFWFRDQTQVSCIAGRCFNLWATREALEPPWKPPNVTVLFDNSIVFWPKEHCVATNERSHICGRYVCWLLPTSEQALLTFVNPVCLQDCP